jgi:hypothetical protein
VAIEGLGSLRQPGGEGLTILGATQTVLNAVAAAPGSKPADLLTLPGVIRVERMEPLRRHMNRALDLVAAREAWSQVGGISNAGAGVRIGIIDTGSTRTIRRFKIRPSRRRRASPAAPRLIAPTPTGR